jgi:coenzyme Q-binding protein COQ10
MTSLNRQIDLPYRPEDLFDLVSDVGRYPDFIKWIRSLRLISEEDEPERWRGRAEASVGFKGFTESFVTDIDAKKPQMTIDVSLVRGPFRKLSNAWRFTGIPTGTRIDFSIAFEFRNFILQTLADANRDYAVNRIIEAFTTEAARRFEKVATPV